MEKPPQKKQLASGFGKNVRSNHSTDMRDEFAPAVNVRSTLTYDDAVYYFRHFSQQTDKTDNKLKFFFSEPHTNKAALIRFLGTQPAYTATPRISASGCVPASATAFVGTRCAYSRRDVRLS